MSEQQTDLAELERPILEMEAQVRALEMDPAKVKERDRLIKKLDDSVDDHARAELAQSIKVYVAEQRKHIAREDREIFPRLRGLLDESAWTLPPRDPALPSDPVVEDEDPGRFKPLVDALLA